MSTSTIERTAPASRPATTHAPIPMSRIVGVEISKMFNTRSGFWLLASVGILSTIATVATILFVPDDEISYDGFAAAVGFPMSVVLPMIAILSITSEWSQRSGLTTFTLVPDRSRVIRAKLLATLGVGAASIAVAFGVGAIGNVVGSAIAGADTTWDITLGNAALIFVADALGMLMGFTLGILIRSSPGAIVGYFVYALVLPAAFGTLAAFQDWFADRQGWIDFNFASTRLYEGDLASKDWSQLAVSGTFWLLIPMAIGLFAVTRSEVK